MCPPPPLVSGVGAHTFAGEGAGGVPIPTNGQTCGTLDIQYTSVLCGQNQLCNEFDFESGSETNRRSNQDPNQQNRIRNTICKQLPGTACKVMGIHGKGIIS